MGALTLALLLSVGLAGGRRAPAQESGAAAEGATRDDWGPGEAWEAAQILPPGLERVRAFRAALEEVAADPEALLLRLRAAHGTFVADHDGFRAEAALALAEVMHEVDRASWSVACLEGILRRMGDYERADAVLAEQLNRTEDPAERLGLLERSAIVAAGAGWPERERERLGRALAMGGTDAMQMLGRLALARGEQPRARALFRVLVERHPGERAAEAPPWALRGWGLALLPTRPDALLQSGR